MRHMNSSGDDLAFTDEVKVYNNEGDDDEDQRKSPETLKEDKVGLVNEGEEKTPLEFDIYSKQYSASMFKVPFSTDARFANYFMSNYPGYMNGGSTHSPFIGNKMSSLMSPPVPNPFSFIPFPPIHDPFAQNVVHANRYNQIPEYKRIAAAAAAAHLYSLPSTSQQLQDVWNSAEMLAAAGINQQSNSITSSATTTDTTTTTTSTISTTTTISPQSNNHRLSFSVSSIADSDKSHQNNQTTSSSSQHKDKFINDAVSMAAAVSNNFNNVSANSGMPLSPSMFAAAAVAAAQAVASNVSAASPPDVSCFQKAAAAHLRFLSSLHYQKSHNNTAPTPNSAGTNGFYTPAGTPATATSNHFNANNSKLGLDDSLGLHHSHHRKSSTIPATPSSVSSYPAPDSTPTPLGIHHHHHHQHHHSAYSPGTPLTPYHTNTQQSQNYSTSDCNDIDQRKSIYSSRSSVDQRGSVTSPESPRKPHIKKPLNAFMLFMKEMRPRVQEECTLKESAAINQILGKKWHELSREDQTKYYELARKEKELHQQLYPGWSARDNYASHSKRRKKRKLISAAAAAAAAVGGSNNSSTGGNSSGGGVNGAGNASPSRHHDGNFLAAAAAVAASIVNPNSSSNTTATNSNNNYANIAKLSDGNYGNNGTSSGGRTPMDLLLSQSGVQSSPYGSGPPPPPPPSASSLMHHQQQQQNHHQHHMNHHHQQQHHQHPHHPQLHSFMQHPHAHHQHHSHHGPNVPPHHHHQNTSMTHPGGPSHPPPPPHNGGSNPKKCRARFGLEHQNLWCKPCRRKKKCVRFIYSTAEDSLVELVQSTANVASAAALATGSSLATASPSNNNNNNNNNAFYSSHQHQLYMHNNNLNNNNNNISSNSLSLFHNLTKLPASLTQQQHHHHNDSTTSSLLPPAIKRPNLSDHSFSLDKVLSNEHNTNKTSFSYLHSPSSQSLQSQTNNNNTMTTSTTTTVNNNNNNIKSSLSSPSSSSSSSSPSPIASSSIDPIINNHKTTSTTAISMVTNTINRNPSSVASISTPPTPLIIDNNTTTTNNEVSNIIKKEPKICDVLMDETEQKCISLANHRHKADNNNNTNPRKYSESSSIEGAKYKSSPQSIDINPTQSRSSRSSTPKLSASPPPSSSAAIFCSTTTTVATSLTS